MQLLLLSNLMMHKIQKQPGLKFWTFKRHTNTHFMYTFCWSVNPRVQSAGNWTRVTTYWTRQQVQVQVRLLFCRKSAVTFHQKHPIFRLHKKTETCLKGGAKPYNRKLTPIRCSRCFHFLFLRALIPRSHVMCRQGARRVIKVWCLFQTIGLFVLFCFWGFKL